MGEVGKLQLKERSGQDLYLTIDGKRYAVEHDKEVYAGRVKEGDTVAFSMKSGRIAYVKAVTPEQAAAAKTANANRPPTPPKSGAVGKVWIENGVPKQITIGVTVYPLAQGMDAAVKDLIRGDEVEFSCNEQGEVCHLKVIYSAPREPEKEKFTPASEIPRETPVPPAHTPVADGNGGNDVNPLPGLEKSDDLRMVLSQSTFTIMALVSLGNYDTLKIGISGPAAHSKVLTRCLSDQLGELGRRDPVTGNMIDVYRKRVLAEVQA